jgi:hypothetical protein
MGCKHVQFQTEFTDSEDLDYGYDEAGEAYSEPRKKIEHFPPLSKRTRPDWTISHSSYSEALERLLHEAYTALDNDLPVTSAIALRTAFDASTEILSIDPAITFEEKLDELEKLQHINASQRKTLGALTHAASAAAHRGWTPTNDQLDTMFTIFENYLYRSFVTSRELKELERRAADLAKKTPKKPKRRKPKTG